MKRLRASNERSGRPAGPSTCDRRSACGTGRVPIPEGSRATSRNRLQAVVGAIRRSQAGTPPSLPSLCLVLRRLLRSAECSRRPVRRRLVSGGLPGRSMATTLLRPGRSSVSIRRGGPRRASGGAGRRVQRRQPEHRSPFPTTADLHEDADRRASPDAPGSARREAPAIVDVAPAVAPELSGAEQVQAKRVADEPSATLERDKIVIDWRTQRAIRAPSRSTGSRRLPRPRVRRGLPARVDATGMMGTACTTSQREQAARQRSVRRPALLVRMHHQRDRHVAVGDAARTQLRLHPRRSERNDQTASRTRQFRLRIIVPRVLATARAAARCHRSSSRRFEARIVEPNSPLVKQEALVNCGLVAS
jgi:hypothetical protein